MNTRKSIEFISWLRGVACLIVMVCHHVGMFTNNDVSAVFSYILPKVQTAPRTSVGFISAFQTYFINFGAFGVAVFFIITGFVTAMSLSEKEYGGYSS